MFLHNRVNKKELRLKRAAEGLERATLTFYKYVNIPNPEALRDELYAQWEQWQVLGRIYLAREGINAQVSVPVLNVNLFLKGLKENQLFSDVLVKQAVEDSSHSFFALAIKVKRKIVADGLPAEIVPSNSGIRLDPIEFHRLSEDEQSIVVDVRNRFESEVGRFKNALTPDGRTFRETLPQLLPLLEDKKDKNILLYCTGGIRCEKASAYLNLKGFKNVFQLDGGIIHYVQEIRKRGLPSNFIGKNFVFDERMGERITTDILSRCYICGNPSDRQVNCAYQPCHTLIVQCENCAREMEGACSAPCFRKLKNYCS